MCFYTISGDKLSIYLKISNRQAKYMKRVLVPGTRESHKVKVNNTVNVQECSASTCLQNCINLRFLEDCEKVKDSRFSF